MRLLDIIESGTHLRQLRHQYDGTRFAVRLEVLLTILESPDITVARLRAATGVAERTLQRWLRWYRDGGIDRLLETNRPRAHAHRRLTPQQLRELRQAIVRREAATIASIQRWIAEQFGVRFGKSGVMYLLENELIDDGGSGRTKWRDVVARLSQRNEEFIQISALLPLLNAPQYGGTLTSWLERFKDGLVSVLPGIDRVTINLADGTDVLEPQRISASVMVTHHHDPGSDAGGRRAVDVSDGEDDPKSALLRSMARHNFPLNNYHTPYAVDYRFGDDFFVGTMIFWANRQNPPIPGRTIGMIDQLYHHLRYVMLSRVTWQRLTEPRALGFRSTYKEIAAEIGLSPVEQDVILLMLEGYSYQDIAHSRGKSLSTVKKQLSTVYSKAGVSNAREFRAKYLTPRGLR